MLDFQRVIEKYDAEVLLVQNEELKTWQVGPGRDFAARLIRKKNPPHRFVPNDERLAKSVRVGRNAQCPCGSGLKHKRCCLRNGR